MDWWVWRNGFKINFQIEIGVVNSTPKLISNRFNLKFKLILLKTAGYFFNYNFFIIISLKSNGETDVRA